MASDGTRVFVFGGYSAGARADTSMSFRSIAIWTAFKIENTEDIDFPDPEPNAVNFNETTTQLAWKSSTGPPTQEQPQHPKSPSSGAAYRAAPPPADYSRAKPRYEWSAIGAHGCE